MSALSTFHADQPYKLTREWGDRWASLLWEEFLSRAEISWKGATVLDFGCAWGYLSKFLVEHAEADAVHGVDLHPMWEGMLDGFRPHEVPGVHLHCGDVREVPALQGVRFDAIVSTGTLCLVEPTVLMGTLHWFHDRLKPGGHCLLQTRTWAHYDGADLGGRAPSFAQLLFGKGEIDAHLEKLGATPARYVNPSCAATYLAQFARAGFLVEHVDRLRDSLDEELFREHAAKLQWLDPEELRTSGLVAHLRRPAMPDLSVLDRDAPHG